MYRISSVFLASSEKDSPAKRVRLRDGPKENRKAIETLSCEKLCTSCKGVPSAGLDRNEATA